LFISKEAINGPDNTIELMTKEHTYKAGGSGERETIRTKKKKRNNVVILINAEDKDALRAIKEEFLLTARKAARKQELGFYIAPIELASFEAIQDFGDFSLKISARNRG